MVSPETQKVIEADWHGQWKFAWERDVPYHCREEAYLDRETGEILYTRRASEHSYLDEEYLEECRVEIEAEPARYERIPPLTHSQHHEIFARWLATVPIEVEELCNTASIGGFFESCNHHFGSSRATSLRHDWHRFHEKALRERAVGWARSKSLVLEWA